MSTNSAAKVLVLTPETTKEAKPLQFSDLLVKPGEELKGRHRSMFASAWENSIDGMRITDEDGVIVAINNAYCTMVGKTADELVGRYLTIAYHPTEDYRGLLESYKLRFREGMLDSRSERVYTLWSGKKLEVELTRSFVESADGHKLVLTQFRDISSRKAVERALEASERQFRDLFDSAVMPMFRSSPSGELLNANGALLKLLGYSSVEELRNVNLSELYINPDERRELQHMLEIKGSVANAELTLKRKNGKRIIVLEHSRIIRNAAGEVVAYEGTLEDITIRKSLERKLQEHIATIELSQKELAALNAQKDKLFSIMSHDLRSPFSSILGFCEMLLREKDQLTEEEKDQFLRYIQEAAQDQLALVNKLLDWSRLESGRIKMEVKELDLSAIANRCVHGLEGLAKQKSIRLCNHLPEGMLVQGDEQLLKQVFNNLLGNALKFTPSEGTIAIALSESTPNAWTLEIRDSGVGIPQQDIPKLFRIEEKFTRRGLAGEKGTGLGLPVVHEIIQKHNGTITVESEPGKGTAFMITLPNPFSEEGSALLVVDDEEGVRVLHSRYLRRLYPHMNVLFAANGEEAFAVAKKQHPKFIVTDYAMPVMTGGQLLATLKADPETSAIPVVVITGHDSYGSVEQLQQGGAAEILMKPVTPEQLAEVVKKVYPQHQS